MTKTARKALLESIEKWRQIEHGEMPDLADGNCSLCWEFWQSGIEQRFSHCLECPVRLATGEPFCIDTPYIKWIRAVSMTRETEEDRVADTPELVLLARKERKFLESLL